MGELVGAAKSLELRQRLEQTEVRGMRRIEASHIELLEVGRDFDGSAKMVGVWMEMIISGRSRRYFDATGRRRA